MNTSGARQRVLVLLLTGTTLGQIGPGCVPGADIGGEGREDRESDLTGGEAASASDFPSTLVIANNCTVAKVGARHILTAAHCVDDVAGGVGAKFAPGASIRISSADAVTASSSTFVEVTVERTVIHPAWLEAMAQTPQAKGLVLTETHPPDVAVIVITQATAGKLSNVPVARVDLRSVAEGEGVFIMGYGCEDGLDGADRFPTGKKRLKIHRTSTLGSEALVHDGAHIATTEAGAVYGGYVITPGQTADPEEASICPGDSGGPVYREDGTGKHVVGVNAYYSFLPKSQDPDRVSLTNWHTRLDESTRWHVGAWLRDQGVSITTTDGDVEPMPGDDAGEGPIAPCGMLVVNEIAPYGVSASDEYVELYNPGTCGIELEGYRLLFAPKAGGSGAEVWIGSASEGIAPGGTFLVAGNAYAGDFDSRLAATIPSSGGGLALLDPSGERLDGVAWREATASHPFAEDAPAPVIPRYESIGRASAGRDTGDNAADFDVQIRTPRADNGD